MTEMIARGAQIVLAISGAYLIALWFVLVVWTYRDIEARSQNVVTQVVSTLLVVLFFVPGVLLYLILRPKETLDATFQRSLEEEYLLQDLEELPLCSSCHRYVEDDYQLCPHCHVTLRESCGACERLVDVRWSICPYCSAPQHGRGVGVEQVEAPAARWIAPGVPRRRQLTPRTTSTPAPPISLPTATPDHVTPEVVAALAQPSTVPSALRSLARPFDRFRDRDQPTDQSAAADLDESEPALAASGGTSVGSVPRGRFRPFGFTPADLTTPSSAGAPGPSQPDSEAPLSASDRTGETPPPANGHGTNGSASNGREPLYDLRAATPLKLVAGDLKKNDAEQDEAPPVVASTAKDGSKV